MTSYFLDTNIFLRFLVSDNIVMQRDCSMLLRYIREKKIEAYTASHVFAEVVWVLQGFYNFSRPKTVQALHTLDTMGVVHDDRVNFLQALDFYEAYSVKFIDALIATNPSLQDGSVVLISYDKDFDKLGAKRVEPDEIVRIYAKKRKRKK